LQTAAPGAAQRADVFQLAEQVAAAIAIQ
jgi:hypothetical protein